MCAARMSIRVSFTIVMTIYILTTNVVIFKQFVGYSVILNAPRDTIQATRYRYKVPLHALVWGVRSWGQYLLGKSAWRAFVFMPLFLVPRDEPFVIMHLRAADAVALHFCCPHVILGKFTFWAFKLLTKLSCYFVFCKNIMFN